MKGNPDQVKNIFWRSQAGPSWIFGSVQFFREKFLMLRFAPLALSSEGKSCIFPSHFLFAPVSRLVFHCPRPKYCNRLYFYISFLAPFPNNEKKKKNKNCESCPFHSFFKCHYEWWDCCSQGHQGLSTRFHVNRSLSPNLPDWNFVRIWTNGRTCNLRFAIGAQVTCSLIGPDQNWVRRPMLDRK